MQIHELNALSRAPQTGDVLAIDTGTDTAKIDYNALATAIINKLGGDPATIPHGGTGATTAAGACGNIGAVKKSGDTMTGTLNVPQLNASYNNANGVQIFSDDEGGNIAIISPDGHKYEIDAYNNASIRVYAFDDNGVAHYASWWRDSGTLFVEQLNVGAPVTIPNGGTGANNAAGALNNFLNQTSRTSIGTWNNSTSVNTYASFDENTVAVYFQLWFAGNLYGGTTEERFRSNSNDDTVILLGEADDGAITRIGVSINWSTNRVTLKHDKWANQYWNLSIYKRT